MAAVPSWSLAGTAAVGAATGGYLFNRYPFLEEQALLSLGRFGEKAGERVHAVESKILKVLHLADLSSNADGKLTVEELIEHLPMEEVTHKSSNMPLLIGAAVLFAVLLLALLAYLYLHHVHMSQREVKGKGTLRVTSLHVKELHRHVESQSANGMKTITISVLNAKHLQNVDGGLLSGTSDPFVKIKTGKTEVTDILPTVKSTLDPVFDHSVVVNWKVGDDIIFEIWDKNSFKKDTPMGQCTVAGHALGHMYSDFAGENMKVQPLQGSKPNDNSVFSVKITPGNAEDHVTTKRALMCTLTVGKDAIVLPPKTEDHPTWTAPQIVSKGKPHEFAVDFDAKVKPGDKNDTRYLQVELCFEGRKGHAKLYIGDVFAKYEGEQDMTQSFTGEEDGMIEVKAIYTPANAKGKPATPAASAAKTAADLKAAAAKAKAAPSAPATPAAKPPAATQVHPPVPAVAKKTV